MTRRTRRAVLAGLAGGIVAGTSGCLQLGSEDAGGSTPTTAPTTRSATGPFTAVATARTPRATFGGTDRAESFGQAVATTGTTTFIGVPQAALDGNEQAGLVAVCNRGDDGWVQTATLTGRNQQRDYFGGQLAASGSTLLVGNEYNYSGTSRIPVSVFEQATSGSWRLTTTLTEPVYVESMAIDGGTAVVRTGDTDGLVDVFEREAGAWSRSQTLSDVEEDTGRRVGSVAIDGETILVGMPPKHGPKRRRADAGRVQVYSRAGGTWTHQTTLAGAEPTDHFGRAVSVAESTALVGDYSNETAYVFGRSAGSWARKQTYHVNTTDAHQYFGETVATDGETLLVGAPHAEVDGSVGAVYSLEPSAGSADPQGTYFTAPEPSAQFGGALATEGGTTVLTGRYAGDGYVYIYER